MRGTQPVAIITHGVALTSLEVVFTGLGAAGSSLDALVSSHEAPGTALQGPLAASKPR